MPTPVRNLEAYPMNGRDERESGVVAIRWDKPRYYNGRLTGYSVEICAVKPDGIMEQRESCPIKLIRISLFSFQLIYGTFEIVKNVFRKTKPKERFLRISNLENDSKYRFIVYGNTNAGRGDPNSKDIVTLPEDVKLYRKFYYPKL